MILPLIEQYKFQILFNRKIRSLNFPPFGTNPINYQLMKPQFKENTNTNSQMDLQEIGKIQKRSGLFKGLLALAVASSPNLSAQGDDETDEIYELSPFSVDASQDTGYIATSTLAGTRVRTDLKDLGAAISVYTAEFLEDIDATDAQSLLSYTSNTEVGGYQGNFSGAQDVDDGRYYQANERTNPQQNQRIRGLGSADLTRGLFLTDIPFDSFNTERVTVSRGPNSLLFGIGSPGGVIDNSVKQAVLNNTFGEVKVRVDNYGSLRGEIDYNTTLVKDRAAFRISILEDNLEYKQDPTFEDQSRVYGALDTVLAKNEASDVLDATRFRFNGEFGKQNGSPVEVIPPSVAYHGWFEPTPANISQFSGVEPTARVVSPSEGGTWKFQETYNPLEFNSEGDINTNSHPNWFRFIAPVWNDPNNSTANLGTGDGLQGYQGLLTWRSSADTLDSTGLAGTPAVIDAFGPDAPGDTPVNRTATYHANSPYSEAYAIGFAVPTLQNTDVFDYRNNVYTGGIDKVEREFSAANFVLEQSFFNNKLAVEIAYDRQHYETYQDFLFSGGFGTSTTGPYDIYASIAEYLPNGQPNPNLGRLYTRTRTPSTRVNEIDRETFRATAFGELDLTEKDGFLKWLGRHRFTGLYNDHTRDTNSSNTRESWVSNDFDIASAVQGTRLSSGRRTLPIVVFTSDSVLGVQSMDDIRINQINIERPQPGDSFNVLYADTSSTDPAVAERTLRTGDVQIERYLAAEGIGQTLIESKAISWQSYLFNENIVGLYGYREDDTESFARATEAERGMDDTDSDGRWNPNFTQLSSTPMLVESGDTTAWSVVARYPENILGNLPKGMDLQAHYAKSENFNPIGLRNNALGQPIGQPTGTTKEYGLLASFANNTFIVKVNWFETALNGITAGPSVNVPQHAYGRMQNYRRSEIDGLDFSSNMLNTVDGDPAAFPIQDYETVINLWESHLPSEFRDTTNPRKVDNELDDGLWDTIEWDNIPNLTSTQDRVAEGFELELVANPSKSWRILGHISQQETVASNTASLMAGLVEEYTASMLASRVGELNNNPDGSGATRPVNELWLVGGLAPVRGARSLDNTVSNEQREWRYTVVSSYRFNEGRLAGFTAGGAARLQSSAATGYVFQLEPETGVPVPDVNRPFKDDGLFNGDLWMSYGRKIWDDKIDWKIQLNVRNAFGDNDDIPVKTNPDGQVAVIRIPNPRTISLSNTFRF
jgi:outer membrane receptor protein involved in Fe transport